MSDPLRTEAARPSDRPGDGEKEARIEQLLLAGLDQYFAGEYEEAINIWTRVVFLERGHSRARAYIDRARGALAERHRESEELLHRGMAAFNSGETDAARDFITRAVERGGPHDMALVLLERLNRLTAPLVGPAVLAAPPLDRRIQTAESGESSRGRWRVAAFVGVGVFAGVIALAAGVALDLVPVVDWTGRKVDVPPAHAAVLSPEPLPLARPAERVLARARAFQSGGHLVDALRALSSIDAADPLRAEADRLRGEIQRQLLQAGPTEASQ